MVINKKKVIAFYSIMSSGHFNVCKSLAKLLLDKYSDKLEIYFIVDAEWQGKLANFDERFKFGVIEYDNDQQKERIQDIVAKTEPLLSATCVVKQENAWINFLDWNVLPEIDRKSEEKILEVADFLICDQVSFFCFTLVTSLLKNTILKELFGLGLSLTGDAGSRSTWICLYCQLQSMHFWLSKCSRDG